MASAGDVNGDGYDDVIVGAYSLNTTNSNAGRAYVTLGGPSGLDASPVWSSSGEDEANRIFGWSVGSAGDVNGDGFGDIIVGAPYQPSSPVAGKAFVYLGNATGVSSVPVWTSSGDAQPGDQFGYSAMAAGDVNNDGYGDVLVGAYEFDTSFADVGKAYVYLGDASGVSPTPVWTSLGDDRDKAFFGYSVASAGDVNGDGHSDIVVGAWNYSKPPFMNDFGKAYVYLGRDSGVYTNPIWVSSGDEQFASRFGSAVASAGDTNGDGFDDILIGAHWYGTNGTKFGKAYVYAGGPAVVSANPIWTSTGDDQAGAWFGESLASAGDVNRDGYADIVVGARFFNSSNLRAGKAYVHLGGPWGPSLFADWTSLGDNQIDAYFGGSVASAGDVNGDLYSEVIVGSPLLGVTPQAGKAFVYTCIAP